MEKFRCSRVATIGEAVPGGYILKSVQCLPLHWMTMVLGAVYIRALCRLLSMQLPLLHPNNTIRARKMEGLTLARRWSNVAANCAAAARVSSIILTGHFRRRSRVLKYSNEPDYSYNDNYNYREHIKVSSLADST